MYKKLTDILFSTRLTAILFLVFAAAMITGTFLDMDATTSPTPYTRTLIYNTWWFEGIMIVFVINFIGNIFRYRLYKIEKWATLVLHLAFIFILIGAGITRYFGFEGMMSIREGETQNVFLSQETYIDAFIDGDYEINGVQQRLPVARKVEFSERLNNTFKYTATYDKQPVTFTLEKFIANAEEDVIADESGDLYLKMVEAGGGQPHNHLLKVGETQLIHNVLIALNKPTPGAINITYNEAEGDLQIESPFEGEYMVMASGNTGALVKDSIQPLLLRSRYVIGEMQMVFPKPVERGHLGLTKKSQLLKQGEDGVVLNVSSNGETKSISVLGGVGTNNPYKAVSVGGLDIMLRYGPKQLELPFHIKLNDFIAQRYPGTERSFSSFESKVTVQDPQGDDFDFHIYMNNILKHRGYRFFQSNYDPDEKGTVLSVNHDGLGTTVTYIGYFLLYLGMLAILFMKNTRFSDLRKQLKKITVKKATTVILLLFGMWFGYAQHDEVSHQRELPTKAQLDSVLKTNITPKEEADKFGKLVIQDIGGRMMPVNTYASEFLRKLTKYDTYEGLTANQVFLSTQESPLLWYNVPVIYLATRKADSLRKIIGVKTTDKYVTLADFFTPYGVYKLEPYLNEAYATNTPNGYQNQLKEADQRVNLLYNTIEGRSLKIFPIPDSENNKWISSKEYKEDGFKAQIQDSLYGNYINTGFDYYLYMLNDAKKTGDYSKPTDFLDAFKKTQHKLGGSVMLSDDKIDAEIAYNKYDIFKKLFKWYMYASALLFVFLMVQIFKTKSKFLNIAVTVFKVIIIGLFVLHTAGLIVRWYISGHAPWSDAYESMIYVAWATMLFGLIFGRKSGLTIASTAFVTSMLLMIAHWSWMDPAIANLQPVLNSYWLMIHVAIIVASYGPFTIGFVLGLVSLLLMIFTNEKNKDVMLINIKELTIINEMALTVGLVMLTIGNFLGGMWANESWGRYWGWDPKETWALISIMIYAFVIHMRLVPGLRGRWTFNLASVIAIAFIIFTYFGVNFYLSGLHSYQSGQQIASFNYIAGAVAFVVIIGFFSYRKYRIYFKK